MSKSNGEFLWPQELQAGGISIYKGIWADPESTIKELEESSEIEYFMSLDDSSKDSKKIENILDRYKKVIQITLFGYNVRFSVDEPFEINEESFVLKLNDGEERQLSYGGGTSTGRSMCAILYLNDDYEGGEIEFINFDLKLKPEKGTLFLFPSNFLYSYKENEVKNGTKYSINTFIHDRPLDDLSKKVLEL
jgi:hypothetical protein